MCPRTASCTEEGATLSTQSILTWVVIATSRLPPSQSQTLAILVAAALRCERPHLAQIGRGMAGPITAKRAIKRAWRFTGNERIEVADGMRRVKGARQGAVSAGSSLGRINPRAAPPAAARWPGPSRSARGGHPPPPAQMSYNPGKRSSAPTSRIRGLRMHPHAGHHPKATERTQARDAGPAASAL